MNSTSLAQAFSGHWLVVDDQEICRAAASDLLADLGATCDFASDGLEAIAALEAAPYAGMLIDGSMPKMSGYEAVAQVRQSEEQRGGPFLPIIMITGEPDAAIKNCGRLVDLIIEKPLGRRPNSLSLAIAEVSLKRAVEESKLAALSLSGRKGSARLAAAAGYMARMFGRSADLVPITVSAASVIRPQATDTVSSPMAELFQKPVPSREGVAFVSAIAALLKDSEPGERLEIERQGVALSFIEALGMCLGMSSAHFREVLGMPARSTTGLIRGAPAFAALAVTQLLGESLRLAEISSHAKAQSFDMGTWLGRWIETPQPAIGGMRPAAIVSLPTGLPILLKLLAAAGNRALQSELCHDNVG